MFSSPLWWKLMPHQQTYIKIPCNHKTCFANVINI
jgi:hypothetical protein